MSVNQKFYITYGVDLPTNSKNFEVVDVLKRTNQELLCDYWQDENKTTKVFYHSEGSYLRVAYIIKSNKDYYPEETIDLTKWLSKDNTMIKVRINNILTMFETNDKLTYSLKVFCHYS